MPIHAMDGRDARTQAFAQAGRLDGAIDGVGQRRRVCGSKVQAVDSIRYFFAHSPDIAADDRPPVLKRFLDHERGILPPDGGHDDPPNGRHPLREFAAPVAAAKGDILARLIDQPTHLALKCRALAFEICAMDVKACPRAAPREDTHRFKQDIGSLERRQLPEKAQRLVQTPVSYVGSRLEIQATILLNADPIAINAPLNVSVAKESTGAMKRSTH